MSGILRAAGRPPRYLLAGDVGLPAARAVDVLVVGAGVAGLSAALSLPTALRVEVALKGRAHSPNRRGLGATDADGSSGRAQGGIAAAFGGDDSAELHLADTLDAGAGLCDPEAVRVLVEEAPAAVRFLERAGMRLDGTGGALDLTREGGHSRRRVVHAGGDATGHELMRGLTRAASRAGLHLVEGAFLVDLLSDDEGAICGALFLYGGRPVHVAARAVVLATGGFGQLYAETTSPPVCTGDGLAAALRAGAALADLEFVQFHPTAIQLANDPRPLASEALRGEGAVIRDLAGRAVMEGVAGGGDLAPRDVVSRAMALEMLASGTDHLYLDATALGAGITERFPSFVAASRCAGVDPVARWVPVAPAVHYVMGGVCTDLWGHASLPGLWAIGEVAESGVHGANRLASNSLVEGVVFGRRAAAALAEGLPPRPRRAATATAAEAAAGAEIVDRQWLRHEMTAHAGVIRSAAGLTQLSASLDAAARPLPGGASPSALEDANLLQLARALAATAARREESRGAHYRSDAPEALPGWLLHQLLTRGAGGELKLSERAVAPVGAAAGAER